MSQRRIGLIGLSLLLVACVPAPEQQNEGNNSTDGQLGVQASPQAPRLERFVFGSGQDSRPFVFDCASGSACSMEVVVVFSEEILRRGKAVSPGADGVQALLDLKVGGADGGPLDLKAHFGLSAGATSPVSTRYTARNMGKGLYNVMLIRSAGLPAELDLMPVQICIGGAGSCAQYDHPTAPRSGARLSGALSRWVPIDIMLGTGSFEPVTYETVELVQSGESLAPRTMQSDASGEWSFDDVLPGSYTLRVAGRTYPITVSPGAEQRADDIVLE